MAIAGLRTWSVTCSQYRWPRLCLGLLVRRYLSRRRVYVDSGDILRVSVIGEASYPLDVVVDDRGSIVLPLLGDIQARGLTTVALSHAIQRLLSAAEADPGAVREGGDRPVPAIFHFRGGGSSRIVPVSTGNNCSPCARHSRRLSPDRAGNMEPALQIADLRSTRANLGIEEYRFKVRLARLQAESRKEETFAAPPDPPVEFAGHLITEIVASEKAQLHARLAAFRDETSYLEASLDRARNEAKMIAASRKEREKTANIQLEELKSARSLREKGLITNSNVMTLERAQTNYRAELAQIELQRSRCGRRS